MKRVQVAVVGGGDAGSPAAKAAAYHGAETINFVEEPTVGIQKGSFVARTFSGDGSLQYQIDVRLNSIVWGLFEDNVLGVSEGSNSYEVQADQVILATGSTDIPAPFSGGSLPGVFTCRAIFKMLHTWRVMPGRRFVVIGDGSDAPEIEREILSFGGEIAARVSTGKAPSIRAYGEQGVEAVEIDGERIQADIVVVAVGRQPDIELALMAECAVGFSQELGGFVPVLDQHLRTTKPSIIVAGDAAGICDLHTALYEGNYAGISAAHALGLVDDAELERKRNSYVEMTKDRPNLHKSLQPAYVQV